MTRRERQREASRRFRERHRERIRAQRARVHPETRYYASVLRGVTGAQVERTLAAVEAV